MDALLNLHDSIKVINQMKLLHHLNLLPQIAVISLGCISSLTQRFLITTHLLHRAVPCQPEIYEREKKANLFNCY